MKTRLTLFILFFFLNAKTNGQNIDTLLLVDKEIPEHYSLTKDNNCISIQACTRIKHFLNNKLPMLLK